MAGVFPWGARGTTRESIADDNLCASTKRIKAATTKVNNQPTTTNKVKKKKNRKGEEEKKTKPRRGTFESSKAGKWKTRLSLFFFAHVDAACSVQLVTRQMCLKNEQERETERQRAAVGKVVALLGLKTMQRNGGKKERERERRTLERRNK